MSVPNYNQYDSDDDSSVEQQVEHIYNELNDGHEEENTVQQNAAQHNAAQHTQLPNGFSFASAALDNAVQHRQLPNGFSFGRSVPTNTPVFNPFGCSTSASAPGLGAGLFGGQPVSRNNNFAQTFGAFSKLAEAATAAANAAANTLSQPPPSTGFSFGSRVERHPETGLPIPPVPPTQMGSNPQPPQSACGGIRNNNHNPILNNQPQSNKQKTIDDLYKKLANARAQIQQLNNIIDEIYETLPKIN